MDAHSKGADQKGASAGEVRRINVVYFLSRGGRTDHPHLFRVNHLNRAGGVRLRGNVASSLPLSSLFVLILWRNPFARVQCSSIDQCNAMRLIVRGVDRFVFRCQEVALGAPRQGHAGQLLVVLQKVWFELVIVDELLSSVLAFPSMAVVFFFAPLKFISIFSPAVLISIYCPVNSILIRIC
jgi:hypothetical protein